ncbi:MAG TPA: phage tail sheath C-terminal domain-containing protein [Thermoanaerobaculia bacterium]|nr:phage tail sheath C-terminal domain-containing protein [Thermoanaerobaculia bacterium]
MPITPTYPGVYIEELKSGVRTITGVATSVTAFVGTTRRGPINRAVRVLGFADFERSFGGLSTDSELSYAVRQFFENGGGEAWITRIAGSPGRATKTLLTGAANVLKVDARDEGSAGNAIRLTVAHNGGSNFTLTARYTSPDDPNDTITETFPNLSMNSGDARWVESMINGKSELITVKRVAAAIPNTTKGAIRSAPLVAADGVTALTFEQVIDDTHSQFRIAGNGGAPVTIIFPPGLTGTLDDLKNKIVELVNNAVNAGYPALDALTGSVAANRITLTSGAGGEGSTLRVLPGLANDASARLQFTEQIDAAASVRPDEGPAAGTFASGNIADADVAAIPTAAVHTMRISIDGGTPETITFSTPAFGTVANTVTRLQTAVRDKRPDLEAFRNFVARVDGTKMVLVSGSRGGGSSVTVLPGLANDIAAGLKLTAGTTSTPGVDISLENGTESPIDDANRYSSFIGSRADRKGIYALEDVDLFNIMCLPGITDRGVLSDTVNYCVERRAFMIVDAPPASKTPAQMETTAKSTDLPKSNYAAVYYPWISISDPLRGGALRTSAPSGTLAGVFARTDATRGVWKAPAGTEASLRGVQAVEHLLTDPENGILNPRGVNCLRIMPPFGALSWGARTLEGDDDIGSEWKYIPVRRLALFIEESLFRGTKWVVFEPNDEPLWAQIRLNVGSFMHDLFRQGAFQGRSPREAYLVKCDRETTTQSDINNGRVNILVGFAPLKPAEFVFIRIQQLAGQLQT